MARETSTLVTQFYLLSMLNKEQALQLSHKIIQKYKNSDLNEEQTIEIVGECYRLLHEYLGSKSRIKADQEELNDLIDYSKSDADLRGWQEFLKKATIEEVGAVLSCHVLGLSESQTCKAFKISQGTLKYRLSRGFRKLGRILGGQTIRLVNA